MAVVLLAGTGFCIASGSMHACTTYTILYPADCKSLRTRYNTQTHGRTYVFQTLRFQKGDGHVSKGRPANVRSALLLAMPIIMLLSAVMSWWSFKAYPTNLFGDGDEDCSKDMLPFHFNAVRLFCQ